MAVQAVAAQEWRLMEQWQDGLKSVNVVIVVMMTAQAVAAKEWQLKKQWQDRLKLVNVSILVIMTSQSVAAQEWQLMKQWQDRLKTVMGQTLNPYDDCAGGCGEGVAGAACREC